MEVNNNYAHVTTQRILNKFIEINFPVGLAIMLSISTQTTSKNIDEIVTCLLWSFTGSPLLVFENKKRTPEE